MFRILFFLIFVFALALAGAWLAERPGTIDIDWSALGLQVTTTTTVAIAFGALLIVAVIILWTLARMFFRLPLSIRADRERVRKERGFRTLADGLIAIAAGDQKAAQRAADGAARDLPEEPATRLLEAQAAQLAGNRDAAVKKFRSMTGTQATKLLGLHGLYLEAVRIGDLSAAVQYVDEAVAIAPNVAWAATAEFEFAAAGRRWEDAGRILDRNLRNGIVSAERYKRLKAVLLTARAKETASSDPASARTLAADAQNLSPELVPAATLACRLMSQLGETRRGTRVIETAWKRNPHPDLYRAYVAAVHGEGPLERFSRVQTLANMNPRHPESSIALAKAAIHAHEFDQARRLLQPLADGTPSQRVCVLMAELEAASGGDEAAVRGWLAKAVNAPRDPVWMADGVIAAEWAPISPVTGRLDAFEWKVPNETGEDGGANPVVDAATLSLLSETAVRGRSAPPAPVLAVAAPEGPSPAAAAGAEAAAHGRPIETAPSPAPVAVAAASSSGGAGAPTASAPPAPVGTAAAPTAAPAPAPAATAAAPSVSAAAAPAPVGANGADAPVSPSTGTPQAAPSPAAAGAGTSGTEPSRRLPPKPGTVPAGRGSVPAGYTLRDHRLAQRKASSEQPS